MVHEASDGAASGIDDHVLVKVHQIVALKLVSSVPRNQTRADTTTKDRHTSLLLYIVLIRFSHSDWVMISPVYSTMI